MARNRLDNYRWRHYQEGRVPDERDQQVVVKPVCTATRKAPRQQAGGWRHQDAAEVPYKSNRMGVTMSCPHCGHEWREPR